MINFYFIAFAKLVLAMVFTVFQPLAKMAPAPAAMFQAGDLIDGMTLTAGAAEARPLWVFCSSNVSNHVTTANCNVPKMEKLAIGHTFFPTDGVFQQADWSQLQWEFSIDGRLVNLNDFATYDYMMPTMAPNPSLVREVFMKFTAWDIVLSNLQPGAHTIDGRVSMENEEYRWIVNLVIEDRSPSLKDGGAGHNRPECDRVIERLSRSEHSCKFYA